MILKFAYELYGEAQIRELTLGMSHFGKRMEWMPGGPDDDETRKRLSAELSKMEKAAAAERAAAPQAGAEIAASASTAVAGSEAPYQKYAHMTAGKLKKMIERLKGRGLTDSEIAELKAFEDVLVRFKEIANNMERVGYAVAPDMGKLTCYNVTADAVEALEGGGFRCIDIVRERYPHENKEDKTSIFGLRNSELYSCTVSHTYAVTKILGEYFVVDLSAGQFLMRSRDDYVNLGVFMVPLKDMDDSLWPYRSGRVSMANLRDAELLELAGGSENPDREFLKNILYPRADDRLIDVFLMFAAETPGVKISDMNWAVALADILKVVADGAAEEQQNIIVAVETGNWIPIDQRSGMQALVAAVRHFTQRLSTIPRLKNVHIQVVWGNSRALMNNIKRFQDALRVPAENIVIAGSTTTLESLEFDDLRGKAFMAKMEFDDISRLYELLTIELKLAFGMTTAGEIASEHPYVDIIPVSEREIHLKARPLDINRLDHRKQIEDLERQA
ncbi:MAG: hypothetical protein PHP46_01410 [Candidatus Omnitrophica bacterium]|nr:hypothetical protein [Candidatus Omnitrophota bacterium]